MSEQIQRILNQIGRPEGIECKEVRRSAMSRDTEFTFVLRPPQHVSMAISEGALEDVQPAAAVDLMVSTMTNAKERLEEDLLTDLVGRLGSVAVLRAFERHAETAPDTYTVFKMCEWLGLQFMELAKKYETKVRR